MIQIVDTYSTIESRLFELPFNISKWREYANGISPSLADKCLKDSERYDFEKEIVPILNAALSNQEEIRLAHHSFIEATKAINEKIRDVFHTNLNVDIILYFGLCNGAGWATQLDDRPTILLGIEKIIELKWTDVRKMEQLINHELGHIWHFQTRKTISFEKDNPQLWQLYCEGMAMFAQQELAADPWLFHQYDDAWKDWCHQNKVVLFNEFLNRVIKRLSVQDFFGDWCSYMGHSDVGYYLGALLVRRLSKRLSYQALCECTQQDVFAELTALAQQSMT